MMESSVSQEATNVDTGEVKVSSEAGILQSVALGSCVAVVVYERTSKVGGIAHIMLPGRSPSPKGNTKYAEDAIDALLGSIRNLGTNMDNLELCIVGGANVLRRGDIPDMVIESVLGYLGTGQMEWQGMRIGGFERRSVFLDVMTGNVSYTEGNNNTKVMLNDIERI